MTLIMKYWTKWVSITHPQQQPIRCICTD
jgi:hypothetical protein